MHTATTFDGWVERLGGGVGALLSVQGCLNAGELRAEGSGLLALTDAGRAMIAAAVERRPMAVSNRDGAHKT